MSEDLSEIVRNLVNVLGDVKYLGAVHLPGGCGNRGWMAWPDEYASSGEPSYSPNDEERERAFKNIVEIGEPAVPVLIEEYTVRKKKEPPALREYEMQHDGVMEGILSCLSKISNEDALSFLRTVAKDINDGYSKYASRLLKKHDR